MEDLYSNIVMGAGSSTVEGFYHHHHLEGSSYNTDNDSNNNKDGLEGLQGAKVEAAAESDNMSDLIKSQIATHPLYPELVSAYISCQKVIPTSIQSMKFFLWPGNIPYVP